MSALYFIILSVLASLKAIVHNNWLLWKPSLRSAVVVYPWLEVCISGLETAGDRKARLLLSVNPGQSHIHLQKQSRLECLFSPH